MHNFVLPILLFVFSIFLYEIGYSQAADECLIINEVNYKPMGGSSAQNTREYVEIFNASNTDTMDIAGWFIRADRNNTPSTPVYGKDSIVSWDSKFPGIIPYDKVPGYLITTTTKIPPRKYALIINSLWNGTMNNPIDIADSTIVLTMFYYSFFGGNTPGSGVSTPNDLLYNSGDFVALYNGDPDVPSSNAVDSVGWEGDWTSNFGFSIQRDDDCGYRLYKTAYINSSFENTLDSNGTLLDSITPGAPNFMEIFIDYMPLVDTICVGEAYTFPFLPFNSCSNTSFTWNFDDPASGVLNTSSDPEPTHAFNQSGSYDVTFKFISSCFSDSIIFPIEVIDAAQINLGNDTSFCAPETMVLDASAPGATYLWSTNETTDKITVSTTGTYSVIVSFGSCSVTDAINVTVSSPFPTTNSITICQGDSIFLAGDIQTTAGVYIDSLISVGGCDSVVNTELIVLESKISHDTITICFGDSFFVGGAEQYDSGSYVDSLTTKNGCDSIILTELIVDILDVVSIDPVKDICSNKGTIFLTATSSGGTWKGMGIIDSITGEFNPTVAEIGANEVIYRYGNPCVVMDTLLLTIVTCYDLWVPNTFTVNEDDNNEIFIPVFSDGTAFHDYQFTIFDRWGKITFSTDNPAMGWDGKKNTTTQPTGVYGYKLSYQLEENREERVERIGRVTLLK